MFIASVRLGVLLLQWLRFSDCMGAASECVAWPKLCLLHDCSHNCMVVESVSAIQSAHCAWYAIHLKTVQVGRAGGLQDENNIAKGVHHQVGPQMSSAYALHTPLSTPLVLSYFLFAAAWHVLCFRGLRLVQSEWESSMMCGPDTFEKSEFSSSML